MKTTTLRLERFRYGPFARSVVGGLVALLATVALTPTARAGDWPTHRHDNRRSGVTTEKLPSPLTRGWVHRSPHPPQTAWTGPAKWDAYATVKDLKSMRNFDPAFFVTCVGDRVFFGSSVDDAAHCLDAGTGKPLWSYVTGGAVRLPPAWADDRVYFASDDGHAYCVNARDGKLVWRQRAAASERLIPSNGKLISLWPSRAGVLVQDGKAYFAGSLLPWDESYFCAVDAKTGSADGDGLYSSVARGTTLQGSLLASADRIYVPQGRSAPLVFDRGTGKDLGAVGGGGGSYVLLTHDDHLVHGPGNKTGWLTESQGKTKDSLAFFPGGAHIIVDGSGVAYLHSDTELSAFDRPRYLDLEKRKRELEKRQGAINKELKKHGKTKNATTEKLRAELATLKTSVSEIRGEMPKCFTWKVPCDLPHELILAGDVLIVGGNDAVAAFSQADGRKLWSDKVAGKAYGLTVAGGRLFVSTSSGAIHCFTRG